MKIILYLKISMLMLSLKNSLGTISCVLTAVAFIPYLLDMYRGITKPKTISWLIWSLVGGIAFFGQISDNGGAGAWSTGVGTLLSVIVLLGSLKVGDRTNTLLDWYCLLACFLGIAIWKQTGTAFWTSFIITAVDITAYIPTFRKAYHKPFEETASIYTIVNIKILLSIVALEHYSVITTLFPMMVIISNSVLLVMLYSRRRILCEQGGIA